ncbi:unnamed protein product, partial [Ectocarpus sp. 6 AP-2014]
LYTACSPPSRACVLSHARANCCGCWPIKSSAWVHVPLSRSTGRRGLTPPAKHLLHATHFPRRLLHTNRQCGRGAVGRERTRVRENTLFTRSRLTRWCNTLKQAA